MTTRSLPVLDIAPPAPGLTGPRDPFAPEDARLEEFRPEPRALPAFFVWTLGCQMNKSDSEEMAGRLLTAGCAEAPSMEAADVVVINTCAIREAAEAKVIGRQGHLNRLKAANPSLRVVMTGCSVRESNRTGLKRRYPAVDLFLRPDEEPELVDRLGPRLGAGARRCIGDDCSHDPREGRARVRCDAPGAGPRGRHRRRRGEPRLGDQRLAADHLRLRQDVHLLHRPVQPRAGAEPAVRRDRRRGTGPRRGRLPRGHAPRPERQLLRPRPRARSRASRTSTPSARSGGTRTATPAPTWPSSSARSTPCARPTGRPRSRGCGSSPRTRGTCRIG